MTRSGTGPGVIVLSGQLAALGAIRSLGEMGVQIVLAYVHDSEPAVASRYVVERLKVPDPEDDEEGFLGALEGIGPRHRGAVVMPASDEMLIAVSRNRDRLDRIYQVAAADRPIVQRYVDKQHTYDLAPLVGVAAPRTRKLLGEDDVERLEAEVAFPVLVKPTQSHLYARIFARKLTEVADLASLRVAYGEASAAGLEVLLQELIPGPDDAGVNYNCYRLEGRPVLEFTAQKLRLAPPRGGRVPSLVAGSLM